MKTILNLEYLVTKIVTQLRLHHLTQLNSGLLYVHPYKDAEESKFPFMFFFFSLAMYGFIFVGFDSIIFFRGEAIFICSSYYQLKSTQLKNLCFFISSNPLYPSLYFGSYLKILFMKSFSSSLRLEFLQFLLVSLYLITLLTLILSLISAEEKGGL